MFKRKLKNSRLIDWLIDWLVFFEKVIVTQTHLRGIDEEGVWHTKSFIDEKRSIEEFEDSFFLLLAFLCGIWWY